MRVLFLGGNSCGVSCHEWLMRRVDVVDYVTAPVGDPPPADLAVSVGYRHRVPAAFLDRLPTINLHTSYLPFNRGACPNVWPIVDGTPAGVTLHWMAPGFDTGDVIARRRVTVHPYDTAWSLYRRLERTGFELFRDVWPAVADGSAPRTPQRELGPGTTHRAVELATLGLRLDDRLPVRDVLAVLRARTYPGYPGVIVDDNGISYEVRVECIPQTKSRP